SCTSEREADYAQDPRYAVHLFDCGCWFLDAALLRIRLSGAYPPAFPRPCGWSDDNGRPRWDTPRRKPRPSVGDGCEYRILLDSLPLSLVRARAQEKTPAASRNS